jgi:ribosomal protein S27AE
MADGNREAKKKRFCLKCGNEFLSRGNRICGKCHFRHWKLFRTAPTGNYADMIFLDDSEVEGHE